MSEVRRLSPSAYGVFSIVLNGRLVSYHYLLEMELAARLDERIPAKTMRYNK